MGLWTVVHASYWAKKIPFECQQWISNFCLRTQVSEDDFQLMPDEPLMPNEIKPVEGPDGFGPLMRIPEDIRPAMQLHRIEVSNFSLN